jgi:hypothetical protein
VRLTEAVTWYKHWQFAQALVVLEAAAAEGDGPGQDLPAPVRVACLCGARDTWLTQ